MKTPPRVPLRTAWTALSSVAIALALGACSGPQQSTEGSPSPADEVAGESTSPRGDVDGPTTRGQQRKLALIIAISNYDYRRTGYKKINADADVPLIRSALERHGFDDVRVLPEAEADLDGIRAALVELEDDARPGDLVAIHYSGHGHRVRDQATPEAGKDEADGYDEVLVPLGAPVPHDGYDGGKHLRDDELGQRLANLRNKLGENGHLLVTLDSCFSGTATRGLPVRGGPMPEDLTAAHGHSTSESTSTESASAGELLDATPNGAKARGGGESGAPTVIISGARDNQYAHETRDEQGNTVGSLSLALSRTLARATPNDTYTSLFENIRDEMARLAPQQSPYIEGDVDVRVFSGEAVEQTPWMRIAKVDSETSLWVENGGVLGLLEGSVVGVYPSGTEDPDQAQALAQGVVREVHGADSRVELVGAVDSSELDDAWIFVKQWGFGETKVTVHLDPTVTSADERAALTRRLTRNPVIEIVDDAASARTAIERRSDGLYAVSLDDGSTLAGPVADAAAASDIREALVRYARILVLRHMKLSDERIDVAVRVIPARTERAGLLAGGSCEPVDDPSSVGALEPGQSFLLEVDNAGDDDVWLTVLNLDPEGNIQQLLPAKDLDVDLHLSKNTRAWRFDDLCFTVAETPGTDVLKVFAMRDQVDFRAVTTSRGAETDSNELAQLLGDMYTGTRGEPAAAPRELGGATVTLRIPIRAAAETKSVTRADDAARPNDDATD